MGDVLKTVLVIAAGDGRELAKLVKKAEPYKPSRYEIRLDNAIDVQTKHYEILREIMRLGIAGKSIVTLRDIGQGGGYSGKDAEKMAIFEHVLKAGPWMVDAELEFASRNPEFVKMINKSRTKLLVSWHDFAGTPDLDGLLGLAGKMSMISNHVKVVTTAKQVSDLLAIERLRREARASGIDITAFAMGEIGQVSRAISALSGELAYTALRKRAVAPGQMDIEQMNELKGLKKIV